MGRSKERHMSIWATQLHLPIPDRDQYGRETPATQPRFHTNEHGITNERQLEPGEGAPSTSATAA